MLTCTGRAGEVVTGSCACSWQGSTSTTSRACRVLSSAAVSRAVGMSSGGLSCLLVPCVDATSLCTAVHMCGSNAVVPLTPGSSRRRPALPGTGHARCRLSCCHRRRGRGGRGKGSPLDRCRPAGRQLRRRMAASSWLGRQTPAHPPRTGCCQRRRHGRRTAAAAPGRAPLQGLAPLPCLQAYGAGRLSYCVGYDAVHGQRLQKKHGADSNLSSLMYQPGCHLTL